MSWFAPLLRSAIVLAFCTSAAFACYRVKDAEVQEVDATAPVIVVKKGEKTQTFKPGAATKVTIDGKEAKLADLKQGDKVSIDYEASDDVLRIMVVRQG